MKKIVNVVILAAGKGSRLALDTPKALAPIMENRLIDFPIKNLREINVKIDIDLKIGIVVGHRADEVKNYLLEKYHFLSDRNFALQEEQLGTGHAIQRYFHHINWSKNSDYTIVICADTPLIRSSDLEKLYLAISNNSDLDGVVATFDEENPFGYGRIIRNKESYKNIGLKIVEEKDASEEQKLIREVNSGLYIFKTDYLVNYISSLENKNNSGEFYLTDLMQLDRKVQAVKYENGKLFLGVNDLFQLEIAQKELQLRQIGHLKQCGVIFLDSSTTYIGPEVIIESGVTIYPQVMIMGGSYISSGSTIESSVIIKDSSIGKNTKVLAFSYLEKAKVKDDVQLGPFARLRPKSVIGNNAKVGNFVEIKNAELKDGAKASHLTYIGDAEIGERTNVGCGFITCNYDGEKKHKTTIGKDVFIGSDCQVIAPINIDDGAFIAAGSTINKDLKKDDFAMARSKQITKQGLARRFLSLKK